MSGLQIREIEVKGVVTKSNLPVCQYSVNPYVGCTHGCRYCYASFMKRFTGHQEPWGTFLDVKLWPEIRNPKKYQGSELFISSVTDPYQPQEEKYRRTRALLEQLKESGAKLSIATKSDLILRDLDLIRTFPEVRVSWSINTLDEGFKEDMDKAVSIKRRLAAMEAFHKAGVRTTCFVSPIFPGITDVKAIIRRVRGQAFEGMRRRGKFLVIILRSGDRIILHLRMTGCLLLTPADYPEEKHTHIVLRTDKGKELRFSDTRRFGRFWLIRKGETDTYSGINKLGREPFDADFTGEYLSAGLGKRKKTVKECLMDQRIITGIGNIYSDEILFAAGIYPARPANSLTGEEWKRLAGIIPQRLSFFIERNEISPEEYLETKGKDYRNTPFLQVYGHEGDPCPICGASLRRMVIGGRSSTYCPHCQENL